MTDNPTNMHNAPSDKYKAIEAAINSPDWESIVAVAEKSAEADAYDADVEFSPMNFERGFTDGFKAGAQWQKEQSGFVKISDMPEEWKDGRPVDFGFRHGTNARGRFRNGLPVDQNGNYLAHTEITHAMLPPKPPNE